MGNIFRIFESQQTSSTKSQYNIIHPVSKHAPTRHRQKPINETQFKQPKKDVFFKKTKKTETNSVETEASRIAAGISKR